MEKQEAEVTGGDVMPCHRGVVSLGRPFVGNCECAFCHPGSVLSEAFLILSLLPTAVCVHRGVFLRSTPVCMAAARSSMSRESRCGSLRLVQRLEHLARFSKVKVSL